MGSGQPIRQRFTVELKAAVKFEELLTGSQTRWLPAYPYRR